LAGPVRGQSAQSNEGADTIERVPIHTDADGVVRVARTRVTLDTIVGAFDAGATAEGITQQYSSVPLADVYSVITYYLRHKPEVCAYLKRREAQADEVRADVERRFPSAGLRERLLGTPIGLIEAENRSISRARIGESPPRRPGRFDFWDGHA
jgi:uncharacterized protein (DUF433 family)